jgi:NAD(P)-dependent dehydrogenase (short-subunit alcohol dehydrogenase family)
MARIFITGSADGLGLLAAKELIGLGHQVALHARNAQRAVEAKEKVPGAETVFTGDLSGIEETKELAEKVNSAGAFDAVIHNAGVYQVAASQIFAVNTLAPYILTCSIQKPKQLIYLSSGMHQQGKPNFAGFSIESSGISYSDSKLHVVMLAMAVARKWPDVYSNAVDPGWVPTKMGGRGAPDDLQKGYETQVWLAASNDEKTKVSGRYFHHRKERRYNPTAADEKLQEELLYRCEKITGVAFPILS